MSNNYPGFNQNKINIDKNIVFCPKVLCIVSKISILDIHQQILTFVFENLLKKKHMQFMPIKPIQTKINIIQSQEKNDNINNIENCKELEICESEYLEFYLSFFYYCLPIHGPPEDYTVIVEGLSEKTPPLMKYHISKEQNLYEKHFCTLFKKMQFPNILKLIKFILLEKSIIVFSKSPNDAIAITETLLSLIAPL